MFLDGWMGGCKSRFKDCLQQSKIRHQSLKPCNYRPAVIANENFWIPLSSPLNLSLLPSILPPTHQNQLGDQPTMFNVKGVKELSRGGTAQTYIKILFQNSWMAH
jgi:hypothetical protein